jgi:hypothetical protein
VTQISIVDSSLLILLDQYNGLERFCKECQSKNIVTITSPKVFEETVNAPRKLARHRDSAGRIKHTIFDSGIVQIEKVTYNAFISKITDRARELIALRSGVPKHEIERADLEIIGLAFAHSKRGDKTKVIFRDRAMGHALAMLAARYDRDGNIDVIDALHYFRDTLKIIR